MVIRELYLKNFGKFSDCRFLLKDGVQVFYGENEYGKSTIYAFIRAMLFGLDRGRGRAALSDDFSRYEPWENPNYYAGVMRFTSGGKTFFLERSFDRYTKSARLVCEDDGEELSVEDGDLEMLLGGMTKESFDNTIAIGQLLAKPGQSLTQALKNYAANYYETGTSTVDLGGALETLRNRKKSVDQDVRRLAGQQEEKKEAVRQECQYVTDDARRLQEELEENQENVRQLRLVQEQEEMRSRAAGRTDRITAESGLDEEEEAGTRTGDEDPTGMGKSTITVGVLGIAAGIAGRIWSALTSSVSSQGGFAGGGAVSMISWLFLAIGILLVCLGCIRYFKDRNNGRTQGTAKEVVETPPEIISKERDEQAKERAEQIRIQLQKLEWEGSRIRAEFREKQVRFQNLQEQLSELEIPGSRLKNLKMTAQALKLAEEKMLEASRNMSQGFGNLLNKKASAILEQITDGRYTRLLADDQLDITLLEEGRRIPVERVSRGTIEQVYFALRMAAAEMLCEDPLPLIFDDAFAFYDEKRLKSTLKWLSEQQRQVIIFTCQKREEEIVKQF